jgi:hypothetical protein
MGRASVRTLLPLDTWAGIVGIDPWSMNQMGFPFPKSAQCSDVIYQYPWQKDHLSREEIAEAIADAERMLADELLYWPAPTNFTNEVVPYPRPHQRNLYGYGGDIRGYQKTVQLHWHKVIKGGLLNRTSLGTIAGGDLTALDLDSDGIDETFQAVITNAAIGTLTDPYEIALYFVAADRHGEGINETWRIRPITVSITGNTATITGHRTLLTNPEPEFAANAAKLDPAIDANYVSSVECYRVFTDDSATAALPYQGVAEWKTVPGCTVGCTFEVKELCLGEDLNEQGRVLASFGSPSTWPCCSDRDPDRLSVNYLAGLPLENGQMNDEMARIVTYLSLSLLANERCGCDRSNRILSYWRKPVLRFEDNNEAGAQAFAASNTPFPMTVGGLYAWKRVKRQRDIEVVGL